MSAFEHCRGLKTDGTPCQSRLGLSDSGYCLNHDPARAEEARAVRVAGGKASRDAKRVAKERRANAIPDDIPPKPKTLDDIAEYLAWNIDAMATGRIDARTGHEIAYSLTQMRSAAEKRDMERTIRALKKQVAEMQKLRRA